MNNKYQQQLEELRDKIRKEIHNLPSSDKIPLFYEPIYYINNMKFLFKILIIIVVAIIIISSYFLISIYLNSEEGDDTINPVISLFHLM